MMPFSMLDLAPITDDGSPAQSYARTVELARHAERLGCKRFWLAEHHGMSGIGSVATAVLIGHVAGATSNLRVGAGGIMLPNHSPLVVAEQFGTLNVLYPGRIDLGLGRAPGTDPVTSRALRRHIDTDPDAFPQDVQELAAYFDGSAPVQAIPAGGQNVPIWILGSSLFGARLAALLGRPYAFASHFAPAQMLDAISVYRAQFQPSDHLAQPHVMLGYNVYAADTDAQAHYLASSWQQSFVNLRSGRPGPLPAPVDGYMQSLSPQARGLLEQMLSCTAIGAPDTVAEQLRDFIHQTQPDELLLTSSMHDHAAQLHSYEIVAELLAAQ